jgi:hypothetical protein
MTAEDLLPEHEGRTATTVGQWPLTGTLRWNRRSKRWDLHTPRPWRKDKRPERYALASWEEVVLS